MKHLRTSQRRYRLRRGIVILEMTMVIFLLLLVTFAVLEYGWMFVKLQEVTNAARRGARIAILPDSVNSDVTNAINALMDAAGLGDSGYQINLDPADITVPVPGEPITVTVNVPYDNITLLGLVFLPAPSNLGGSAAMAKEGP